MPPLALLTRLTLLVVTLCVAAGPLWGWALTAACAEACCCGLATDARDDGCGCEVDAPAESPPVDPLASPGTGTHAAPHHDQVLVLDAACDVPSAPEGAIGPRAPGWATDLAPPPRPPARLLHCSFTL